MLEVICCCFFQMSDDEMTGSGDEDYYNDYYSEGHDPDVETLDRKSKDPEYFEYWCLNSTEVNALLDETVEELCAAIQVSSLEL